METKTRYVVEWCSNLPLSEAGNADIDRATYSHKTFTKFEDAILFGLNIIKKKADAFGVCEIEYQEYRIDDNILENEERTVYKWFALKNMFVDDLEYEYSLKDLEILGE